MSGYAAFVGFFRQALFWLAAALAIIALVDWAVRTRRLNPFGPVARFFRRVVDPMMAPVERRVVRAGTRIGPYLVDRVQVDGLWVRLYVLGSPRRMWIPRAGLRRLTTATPEPSS